VSRRPRVPGTRSPRWRKEIACGNDPTLALVRALSDLPAAGAGVWSIAVHHDDGCPAFEQGGPMGSCSCELVEIEARRAA
jgi:hypothetical protein